MSVVAFRRTAAGGALVLLAFTGSHAADAQPPQDTPPQPPQVSHRNWVDDPYAPHNTDGTAVRVGTAVGPFTIDQRNYTALGAVVAVGRRVSRFTFELELDAMQLQDPGPSSQVFGHAYDVAMVGRVDVLRLGPDVVGANSMIAFYGEAAMERAIYRYTAPDVGDQPRLVPVDSSRTQAAVGFGALLDHRLEQPLGFPNRIGWQLGWRLATAPRDEHDHMVSCRGCLEARGATMMSSRVYDTELLVTSTLEFTW